MTIGVFSRVMLLGFVLLASHSLFAQRAADSLTMELEQVWQQAHFNGFSVAVVNEKGMLYQKGFGVADIASQKKYTQKTIQPIASVSKTLVGVALMKAQELGMLKLDDPINKYLPFTVANPYFPDAPISIRHLANHTSSIADNQYYLTKNYYLTPGQETKGMSMVFDDTQVFNPYDSLVSLEAFLRNTLAANGKWNTKDGFLQHKPGALYEYSNTATSLAAYIVQRASGMDFSDFTHKHILAPLGMKASGWHFGEVRLSNHSTLYENPKAPLPFYTTASYPDGGFITSAHDLALFLTELIKGYNGKAKLLSKQGYEELFRPQLSGNNFTNRNDSNPYSESYNVSIFMGFGYTGYIGHTGGDPGVVSIMFFNPETNIGRLLILNTSISDKAGNDAFYKIWDLMDKYSNGLVKK